MRTWLSHLRRLWRGLRQVTGDDAYERYLVHWHACHAHEGRPLSRKAFFKAEQERKWNGIRRCC
ncbi:MAG: CstA-like transporter-associated (seleno)protein [Pseudomonadota bacterium]